LTLTEDGHFLSRFLMPYADGARIELHNETEADIDFRFAVETASLSRPIGDYGRFHAKWSRNMHPVLRPDRFPDHTWLRTSGRGRYLGVSFHAYEREDFGWWGEGDEKIFVDGEKYPSWFGTGSEDYFGFCWGKPIMFQRPYHAQIRQDGGFYGAGHKVDLRLHHVDSIPFQNEIEVTIEKYLEESKVSYDTVCFWYLSPAGLDDYPVVPFRERIAYWSEYVYRPVERIELRHKSVTLAENEECRIVWNVLPVDHSDRRELAWTSSDPETVSVDSRGQILALKPGKARLIASIGRVKSSCLVTVTPKQDPPPANPGDLDYVKAHTVGLYTFEDPSSPGRDFSGSGNDLTYYTRIDGAYTVCPEACRIVPAAKGKKALYFDGVTFLTRDPGVGSAFDSLHNFTVSYRSHMPAYGADGTREMKRNYKTILDKGGFTSRTGWVMCSENDTLVAANEFMSIWDKKDEFHLNIVNAPHFIALCWTQITFTVNADTGRVAVFHNRDLVKEMTVADLHPENPDHPFTLGGAIVPAGNGWEILNNSGFVGELTDVRILDVALEDGQIAALQ
ncbi:MAG: DUF2961 domain-containing protein, partial [Clostridia bacterium]|nr:DUF2961 domain-containing protein [Clostridia bacterium]